MTTAPSDPLPRPHRLAKFLLGALDRPFVRWGLGACALAYVLLLAVLLLTEQLRWFCPHWPPPRTRALFQTFLAVSVLNAALFGTACVGSAVVLYRRRRTDTRANPMTLVQRAFIMPTSYLLSVLWGGTWLTGHSPRLFGGALVALFVVHQAILMVYFTVRAVWARRAAGPSQKNAARRQAGLGRRIARAIRLRLASRARMAGFALSRRWWVLTHPRFMENMLPPDRALFQSAVRGVTQNIEVLLRRGANPNLRLMFGDPLIYLCAYLGRTEAVRLLLDAGADITAACSSTRFTALHTAADHGNVSLARLLVERGADLEARLGSGVTPLMLAAREGHAEVVGLLLASGARIDAATAKGMTALHWAAHGGHEEAVQALLDAGVDVTAKTASGRTALGLATEKGHQAVAALLESVATSSQTRADGV